MGKWLDNWWIFLFPRVVDKFLQKETMGRQCNDMRMECIIILYPGKQ